MNLDIQKERGTRGGTTCASTLPNKKSSQSPQTTRIIDFSDEDVNEPSIATVLLQSSANRGSSWIINKRTSWPTNEDNNYEDEEHGVEELQKGKYKHIAEDLDGLTSGKA